MRDVVALGIIISQLIREIVRSMGAREASDRRVQGGCPLLAFFVGARSVLATAVAISIKPPADKSSLCHVQCWHALVDNHILMDAGDIGA